MPYASLVAELTLRTTKFEQGLDFADTLMKGFVGPTRTVKLGLDTRQLNGQLRQMETALTKALKPITIPVDLSVKVNGQKIAIEQSRGIERSIKAAEQAQKQFDKTLSASLNQRAAEAAKFEAALKRITLNNALTSAKEVGATLKAAEAEAARLKTNLDANVGRGLKAMATDINAGLKEAEANAKRLRAQLDASVARGLKGMRTDIGAGIRMDASNPLLLANAQKKHDAEIQKAQKFTSDFNAHLGRMQGLLSSAAAKSAQLSGTLSTTGKAATFGANAFMLLGRGLSALGTVGASVSRVLLGIGRNLYSFARAYVLMPLLIRSFGALREATIGYSVTLERARTSLTSMMGGSQKAATGLLDKLEEFAVRTQFSFDDVAALAPQLRVARVESGLLIPTFTALGDAVTSAGKGRESLKALVGDMVSLSMRGKVTGQDLRNFAANGVNLVTYLAQAYSSILPKGTQKAEIAMRALISKGIIPADKAIKAFVAGVENDPLRAGAMAKQARTYEGAMSNIGDAIKRVLGKEAFGDTFEWLTKKINRFLDIISSPALLQLGKDMAPRILAAFKGISSFFGAVINYGAKSFSVLKGWIGGLLDALPRVQKAGTGAFEFIGAAIRSAARVAGFFMVALNPLTPLFQFATQGAHDFWDVLRGVGSLVLSIGEGLNRVMIPAIWAMSKPVVGLSQLITGVFDKIPQNLLSRILGSDASKDLSTLMDGLKSATQFVVDATSFDGNQKLWQGLQDTFNDGVNATEQGWERIKKTWQTSGFDSPAFKNLTRGLEVFAGASADDFTMPNYGWGDTNKNAQDATKAQAKALGELAQHYDKLAKSAEDSATRQLNALKGVRDTLQDVLGSIQSDLAKFGIFNSSVFDQFARSLQNIVNLDGKSSDIVAKALERMKNYGNLAKDAREGAKKLGQSTTQGAQANTSNSGEMPASTALVGAGKAAGSTLIENLVREFNDKSSRKLGASCADVAAKVMKAIGQGLEYSANAGQLEANAKKAGWKPVPLGTRGALHFQGYPGNRYYGKVSGEHVTVGLGNDRVMGSSNYRVSTQSVASLYAHDGRPRAYMPKNGVSIQVPKFLNNPMGVGGVAALENGDNGVEGFKQRIQELLRSLNLSKLSLPSEWGNPIREAADQAHMFQAQMMLANENTQALLRAILGEKFAAFVKRLREGTFAADKFLKSLGASDKIKGDIEQGIRDKRARGQENNPYFELDQEYIKGGKLTIPIFEYAKRAEQIRSDVMYQAATAFDKLKVAETDRLTVVKAGLPFLRQQTVDLYGYARALQLAQDKLAYARSPEMVKVFKTDKREFNLKLAEFVEWNKARYEQEKGEERELGFATMTRDLGRRLAQLQAELKLVGNLTLSEGQLNTELEKQGYYFGQLWQLRDAGHDDERSIQLARQLTSLNAINEAMARAITAQREWNKSVNESNLAKTLNEKVRGLYATLQGGALDRAVFEAQTRSGLKAQFDSGAFDVPTNLITTSLRSMRGIITAPSLRRNPLELEKRVQQAMQGFDDKTATDRVAEANAKWTQMQNDLLQRRAELERPLSELAKVQLEFKARGQALSVDELGLQQKILNVARQLDSLTTDVWRKQQERDLKLASIFDPRKRADQQFKFEHMDWSEEQINAMLPVDQMNRKLREGFERMQGLMDGWRDEWSNLFRDISKGQFTFGKFLDGITNKLIEFAANTLSSAAFQGLQGLLGKVAGGLLGTTHVTPYAPVGGGGIQAGLAAGGHGLFGSNAAAASGNGLFRSTSAASSSMMMQAARELAGGAARQSVPATSGEIHNWNFTGATINVAEEESLPEAAKKHVQQQRINQPTHDSRRTVGKKIQTIIGNR